METPAQMAEALAPPKVWDLILSDYSMPEFSGLRALALYKQSGLDIPFLLISGIDLPPSRLPTTPPAPAAVAN